MKTTEEMMDSLLERKKQYDIKKRNTIKRVSTISASLCLVVLAIIIVPNSFTKKTKNTDSNNLNLVSQYKENEQQETSNELAMTGLFQNSEDGMIKEEYGEHYEIVSGETTDYISGMYIEDKPIEEVYPELDHIYETGNNCYYVRFFKDDIQYVIIGTDIMYDEFESIYEKEKE